MTLSEQTRYSRHDDLKHVLASSLRTYTEAGQSAVLGDVSLEERILAGDRRIDVGYEPHMTSVHGQYAFEVKTSIDNFAEIDEQLSDYLRAGRKPVVIIDDQTLNEITLADDRFDQSPLITAKERGAVVEAKIEDSLVTFNAMSGFDHCDRMFRSLQLFWGNRRFKMNILGDREQAVLRVLNEGRANPLLIRKQTELDQSDVSTALLRLGRANKIEQVVRGLYRITEKGRQEVSQ
jgi:hypothetical protein